MHKLPTRVIGAIKDEKAQSPDPIALFVYDLDALQKHIQFVVDALPDGTELYYAIKANSDRQILDTLAPWVKGFEISSGGEIDRIKQCCSQLPFIFSGPGKLDSELEAAIQHNVEAIHLESLNEIQKLQEIAAAHNHQQTVFIRINPSLPETLFSRLTMAGRATPFGIDEQDIEQAIQAVDRSPNLTLKGFHVHAMSHQKSLEKHKILMDFYLKRWPIWQGLSANPNQLTHLNVGGGIGVNYTEKEQFDWLDFCRYLKTRLAEADNPPILRFEPGRFISAFCGYYAMEVLDTKNSHGESFLVCRGGTHQFRLPVAQNHDHPTIHLPEENDNTAPLKRWTLVGQLCTPKDILSRNCNLYGVEIGDVIVLPLAGAYGYNISHVDFLCHPRPSQTFLPVISHVKEPLFASAK